jgi:hypothetical protein
LQHYRSEEREHAKSPNLRKRGGLIDDQVMIMRRIIDAFFLLLFCSGPAWGDGLEIAVKPGAGNAASPPSLHMGDRLTFESAVTNTATKPAQGVVAWMSLVEMTPGQEQPVDLEDWSAHKAETRAVLAPGESIKVAWPMRLIKAGDYRIVISATERNAGNVVTSPALDFHVLPKPVIESSRVLPVAFGVPLLLGSLWVWQVRRRR